MKRTITVRAAALTAVAALGLSGLGLGAAFAAPGDGGNAAVADVSSIDPDVTKSLTIHKFTPSSLTKQQLKDKNDGTEIDTSDLTGANPIDNVTFTIYKLNLDMKKNKGWEQAEKVANKFREDKNFFNKTADEGNNLCGDDFNSQCSLEKVSPQKTTTITDENSQKVHGVAKFNNLKIGYYLVEESLPTSTEDNEPVVEVNDGKKPAVVIWENGEKKLVDASKILKAKPFLVAVPMTDPRNTAEQPKESNARTKWLYDVHVYPKNSSAGVGKTVKDQNTPGAGNTEGPAKEAEQDGSKNPGSKITYTITTDIPAGESELNSYAVIDPLNKQLEYVEPDSEAFNVYLANDSGKIDANMKFTIPRSNKAPEASNEQSTSVKLVNNVDYELINEKLDTAVGAIGTVVTLKFTDLGLRKLIAARDADGVGATKVVWELTAGVKNTGGEGSYNIPNTATLVPPNDSFDEWTPKKPGDTPPGTDTPPVESKYGKVTITKKGEGDNPLNGAKFQLFLCNSDGDILDYTQDAHPNYESGKKENESLEAFKNRVKIWVNNKSEWESQGTVAEDEKEKDKGEIVIDGLQLNDWENGKSLKGEDGTVTNPDWYCLVETQAPDGYELLPNPIKFQLLQENNTAEDGQAPVYEVAFPVKNVKKNGGFELPVTGGQGIALLVTAGGLLVAGSVIYTVAAARKRKQQA